MDQLYAPPPPQYRKPKRKPKSIFEDDKLLIEKARAYLQLHQNWQNCSASGEDKRFLFASDVAQKLKISEADAEEMMVFALSPEFGEFEADYIRNTTHISIDFNGNEIQRPDDPFGFGEF
jgi:hypothetical protein